MSFNPASKSDEGKAMGNGFPIDASTDTSHLLKSIKDKIFFENSSKIVSQCFRPCVEDMNSMYLSVDEIHCLDVCYSKHLQLFDLISPEISFHLKQTSPF